MNSDSFHHELTLTELTPYNVTALTLQTLTVCVYMVLLALQVDSLCSTRGDSESEAARRIKTQLMVEIQVGQRGWGVSLGQYCPDIWCVHHNHLMHSVLP